MQDLSNSRSIEMRQRMELLAGQGQCYFCKEGQNLFEKTPLHEGRYWYVTYNDSPYKGAVTHVMVVPKRHLTQPEELTGDELVELYQLMIPWLRENLQIQGASALFRFGDTKLTGATLQHFHVHFIHGVERSGPGHSPIWAVVGFQKP